MDTRVHEILCRAYGIDEALVRTADAVREKIERAWAKVDQTSQLNQIRVLEAFQYARVSEPCLAPSSGYGYGDLGRARLEQVYARVFGAEAALVRRQFVSGTHAIACALFAATQPGKSLICAAGKPYDSLAPVLGPAEQRGSLAHRNVEVETIDLDSEAEPDTEAIACAVSAAPHGSAVLIQRSCGYTWRPSLSIDRIRLLIETVRDADPSAVVVVDNCYGEFVEDIEPGELGADLVCGSLIKNPGGGLCPTGAYIVGKSDRVEDAAEQLSCPGLGSFLGSNASGYRDELQGLFMAPSIVGQALKGAIFAARFFEELGFEVSPHFAMPRTDIIQMVKLGSAQAVTAFCRGIQRASAVDSFALPEPAPLPGYEDGVIMAGGTFVQGSSIELSADAPMREPYAVFMQGGLSAEHAIVGAIMAAHEMHKEGLLQTPSGTSLLF